MKLIIEKLRNLSLKWKIIISYILIITIPIIYISIYFYNLSIDRLKNDYNHILDTQAEQIKYNIENILAMSELTSASISRNESIRNYLQFYSTSPEHYTAMFIYHLSKFLKNITEVNPYIHSIRIYKLDKNLPNYEGIIVDDDVVKNEAWYQEIQNQKIEQVLWRFEAYETSKYPLSNDPMFTKDLVFSHFRKIYSNNYNFILSYLEVNIKTETLYSFIEPYQDNDIIIILTNNKDEILNESHNPNINNFSKEDLFHSNEFISDSSRNQYIYVKKTIKENNLCVYVIYPYIQLINSARLRLFGFMTIIFIIVFSLFIIVYLVTFYIFKGLKELITNMGEVQKGNYNITLKIKSKDEIGVIKDAFNNMVQRILAYLTCYKLPKRQLGVRARYYEQMLCLTYLNT